MTSSLLVATMDLLDKTNIEDWKRLAKQTGLTHGWIRCLAEGTIKEPGINKIELLFKALGGNMTIN